MVAIEFWTKTAGGNIRVPPNGAPENMAPSDVNDWGRETMASVRTWFDDPEWQLLLRDVNGDAEVVTWVSNTSFTVANDWTTYLPVNRLLRFDNGAICEVASASFGASLTTVTVRNFISGSVVPNPLTTVELYFSKSATAASLSNFAYGDLSARPLPADFGQGVYFARDTGQVYHSNGTAWSEFTIDQRTTDPTPSGTAGRISYQRTKNQIVYDDGSTIIEITKLPLQHIAGLEVSNTAPGVFTIAAGQCRGGTRASPDQLDMASTASIQKDMSGGGGWQEGSGPTSRGKPAALALAANTPYRCFAFAKNDGSGSLQAGIDSDASAANLLAEAQVVDPLYTLFRQISWRMHDNAGTWFLHRQIGDEVADLDMNVYFQTLDFTTERSLAIGPSEPTIVYGHLDLSSADGPGSPGTIQISGVSGNAVNGGATYSQGLVAPMIVSHGATFSNVSAYRILTDATGLAYLIGSGDTSMSLAVTLNGWRDQRLL